MTVLRGMAWSLAAALVALVASCATHPWFKSRLPWEPAPDPHQQPVITNRAGESYNPGTPSWVTVVDDCLRAGGSRADCIAELPQAEQQAFDEWEQETRRRRRALGTAFDMGDKRPRRD